MLRGFVEKNQIDFYDKFDSWEEAIWGSCRLLLGQGVIDDGYVEEIIANVKEYGPYIIIAPEVAMPHSTLGSNYVHETTISFTKVEKPVVFDPSDETKNARLFFTLAAVSDEEHLKNMMDLSNLLLTDGLIDELLKVTCAADIIYLADRIESIKEE